jgi:hypothetical protein
MGCNDITFEARWFEEPKWADAQSGDEASLSGLASTSAREAQMAGMLRRAPVETVIE